MNSIWLECSECPCRWFFQLESGETPLHHCTECGSSLVEVPGYQGSTPAGGGGVGDSYDPDAEVIEMIRQAFGPDVTEVDPSERWSAGRETAGIRS